MTHPTRQIGSRERLCAECGHPASAHVEIEPPASSSRVIRSCVDCDDAAQLGQYAPCAHALPDIPPGATFEPWSDADDAELAREMAAAAEHIRDGWSAARNGASDYRRQRADGVQHALAVAAAESGLVPDRWLLPLNAPDDRTQRQRELGDVWAGLQAARADKTTHDQREYESHDGHVERERAAGRSTR